MRWRIVTIVFSLVLFWGYRVEAFPWPSLAWAKEAAAPMRDHQNGLAKWQEGLEWARKSGNLKGMDDSLSAIAAHYEELGQYEKASDYRQQSLIVQRKREIASGKAIHTCKLV